MFYKLENQENSKQPVKGGRDLLKGVVSGQEIGKLSGYQPMAAGGGDWVIREYEDTPLLRSNARQKPPGRVGPRSRDGCLLFQNQLSQLPRLEGKGDHRPPSLLPGTKRPRHQGEAKRLNLKEEGNATKTSTDIRNKRTPNSHT